MEPADNPTLLPPADERQASLQLRQAIGGLSGAGTPFDGVGAQLGLDGQGYDPAAQAATSLGPPSRTSGSGAPDQDDDPDRPPERPAPVLAGQGAWEWADVPQHDLWTRRRAAGALADRPGKQTRKQRRRPGPHDRLSKCCHGVRHKKDTSPQLYRTERGKIAWRGLIQCEEKCCPHCGVKWAHSVCNELGAIFDAWLRGDGGGLVSTDVWMLTLALPHSRYDDVTLLVRVLYEMAPAFLRTKEWRAFAERFAVGQGKVVRVIDSTHGGDNGAHPHLHCALLVSGVQVTADERRTAARDYSEANIRRPDGDDGEEAWAAYHRAMKRAREDRARAETATWTDASLTSLDRREREVVLAMLASRYSLWSAWSELIKHYMGPELARFGRRRGEMQERHVSASALRLTPGEDAARYFTAWGLESEIGGTAIKSRSHLRLLDAYASGIEEAGAAWREWREAMKGKTWAIGLTRARRAVGITSADVQEYAKRKQRERDDARRAAGKPVQLVPVVSVVVPSYLWGAACLVGLDVIEQLACDAADAGRSAQDAVTRACWAMLAEATRRARGQPPPE